MSNDYGYDIKLINVNKIIATEHHCKEHAYKLSQIIKVESVWTDPLIIEKNKFFVMDGHHRLAAAQLLGFSYIPCILLEYSDTRLSVSSWRPEFEITESLINQYVQKQALLPYKTTRHTLNPKPKKIKITINELTQNESTCSYAF
ncbi:ParB N-terminal domain-containing protein [Zooshikella marina]|uniref:ParB N-terminal domain-containing protein n=1 Tax=Zooshikella ganghwensis TaxID=202772 RepID=UPI001BAE61FA|nr:ParB N-terminal domain-containing protein [Zooshikella ganghwensis]MBU2708563.1 ParB N-terminal domain-containing protein [Zooshikella ganghwensis]